MTILFILLAFFTALPASANQDVLHITVPRRACEQLIKHKPFSDVEFKEGVDVMGRAVAPANVEGAPHLQLPEVISIDISSALSLWLPADEQGSGFLRDKLDESVVNVGTVTVQGDKILYNNQPLTNPQQDHLATHCADLR